MRKKPPGACVGVNSVYLFGFFKKGRGGVYGFLVEAADDGLEGGGFGVAVCVSVGTADEVDVGAAEGVEARGGGVVGAVVRDLFVGLISILCVYMKWGKGKEGRGRTFKTSTCMLARSGSFFQAIRVSRMSHWLSKASPVNSIVKE